jgi:hypothetical protein
MDPVPHLLRNPKASRSNHLALLNRPTARPPVPERSRGNRGRAEIQRSTVYSKVIIIKGESRAEYQELLTGLQETLQPEGTLEELLVENLAGSAWRRRRLLVAESAEIQKNKEFFESDKRDREGLIEEIHNPDVLKCCLKLLNQLWNQIQQDGFNLQLDERILEQIYGHRGKNRLRKDLYEYYLLWLATSEVREEKRSRKHFASPEQCRKNMLRGISEEFRRLSRDQQAPASVWTARTQLEIACRNVPDGPGLDRLLRYEATLERSFARTLSQLVGLQRIRLGQPALPNSSGIRY